jgi:hypothetical protein
VSESEDRLGRFAVGRYIGIDPLYSPNLFGGGQFGERLPIFSWNKLRAEKKLTSAYTAISL